ncbi:MAG: class I SAM-dependent methyltransferase [Acidobacteria bacterium]|nr:class I SAM-dependent methyltransferase [Acidobacteriota bacterium]
MESQTLVQLEQMKADWNRRAVENARWYINTLRLDQSEEEFDRSGREGVEQWIVPEIELLTQRADPKSLRLLEIGCGIGRMTRHLAEIFGQVHATDVSGEMIERARHRLSALPNVNLYETSGVDVAPIPDEFIDVAFSIFVFQHVPSKEAIRSTLVDAWRTLRPGGLLRFQTNGVTAETFRSITKNTWVGETYAESDVRELAVELGAQVVSIYGAGTLYCFSTLRKPFQLRSKSVVNSPKIEMVGRSDAPAIDEIPAAGSNAWVSLVVSGFDPDLADSNRLRVEIDGIAVVPRYAGQIRPHFQRALGPAAADWLYLEAGIPGTIRPGLRPVRIISSDGESSPVVKIRIIEPLPVVTTVISFRNQVDFGTDIEVTGPKSAITICVDGLDQTATIDNVSLVLAGKHLRPLYVGYDPHFAGFKVELQLPAEDQALPPGLAAGNIIFKGVPSNPLEVELKPETR